MRTLSAIRNSIRHLLRFYNSQSSDFIDFKRRALVYTRTNIPMELRPKPSMSVAYSPARNEGGTIGAVADMAMDLTY